ncbi:hypothetical protein DICPUDRAFT_157710 [Dictyostelium purpureum]|uniref:Uncharacterized protein n=1 Tax=Dictyostelium purpureum TaxID=5786 RepID=F0ZZT0_DICPU|nr:uncharacterized protein DICPUDRAFT_157710 [Dictyostelium purpureum]EGC30553.1 hypothetical protein DICPUDRAFT_157710 [Dictyostelium purpureum]|eukprot:XP_003292920.1 hypothetical protein DICPUDRAFT_157710 [Dictyostelium purpureum]
MINVLCVVEKSYLPGLKDILGYLFPNNVEYILRSDPLSHPQEDNPYSNFDYQVHNFTNAFQPTNSYYGHNYGNTNVQIVSPVQTVSPVQIVSQVPYKTPSTNNSSNVYL